MFQFSLVNQPAHFALSDTRIQEIFAYIAKVLPKPQAGTINIAFASPEEMQSLNRDYRGMDRTTDVLSFHYFEDFSVLSDEEIAGECIFLEEKILSQAEEFAHSAEAEFEILLIHSLLHILGYDHETDEDFEVMWHYEAPAREHFGLSQGR